MIGITSYGGYIPRLRMNRGTIYGANAWMAPGLIAFASGERSMCNWDEDSLTMAVEASMDCIKGMDKEKIDLAYVASLTFPFLDRQNAGILSTALNLKESVESADFSSSMRAGASALLAGLNALKSGDYKSILVAAADRRISKMAYLPELWYGDGAAALLLGSDNVIAEFKGAYTITDDFVDHFHGANQRFDYNWEERWIRDEGFNKIVPKAIKGLLDKVGVEGKDIARFVMPCIFPRVVAGIGAKFGIEGDKVYDNMHNVCGETGTAHSLVMLVSALQEAKPGDKILYAAFGQGCTAILFEVTKDIGKLNGRAGIAGALADRKEEGNYIKFLTYRELVIQDWGMRAEADWKTALTTLYRNKKRILGMVGGKCTKCGTAQFPKMDICVNPDCGAVKTQEDLEFANQPGKVKTYTGDLLTYTMDPPAHYGMVEFENGGRSMFDFTDYDVGQIDVGLPVKMVFRIRNIDKERGFTQYIWKAKPILKKEEA